MSQAVHIHTTVMFADICSSTQMFSRLGDEQAASLIAEALAQAASIVRDHDGDVLRSMGDDILCIFSQPLKALEAALAIHKKITGLKDSLGHSLAMRIGINSGPAVQSDGDIHGDSVNTAARLSSLSKEGQTLISSITCEALGNQSIGLIRSIGDVSLKGRAGLLQVYELLAKDEQDEITQIGSAPVRLPQSNQLSLQFQSRTENLNYLLIRFLLGRSFDCDLVLDHPLVSRHHAEIRYQNNEFVLIDFSTNGTTLIIDGQARKIHHNQAAMRGRGTIFLGGTVYSSDFAITFHAAGGT